jgi:hypothetical protein
VLYRNARKIEVFDTANIDGGHHCAAARGNAFSVWMNAAIRAEAMLDRVFVKCVGAGSRFRREEL